MGWKAAFRSSIIRWSNSRQPFPPTSSSAAATPSICSSAPFGGELPDAILNRRDKMGFPVPLKEWFAGELRDFVQDMFRSRAARSRPFMNADAVLANFEQRRTVFAQDLGPHFA